MKICGIYSVTHLATGRMYIGKSCDIHLRWREHVREANLGKYKIRFHNALRKYGEDAFAFEIIEECELDQLEKQEIYWIAAHKSVTELFNHTPGGDGLRAGSKHSEDANRAKSARQKGRPHSAEHNRKVSESLKGIPRPKWIMDKMAAANRGRPRYFSEEHRKRISAAKTGKKMPEGTMRRAWETRRVRYGESGMRIAP